MQYSSIFWWTMLWIVFWGVIGGIGTRRVYLRKDRDTSNATLGRLADRRGVRALWVSAIMVEEPRDWPRHDYVVVPGDHRHYRGGVC